MATAITIHNQVTTLQTDIKASLEAFFEQLPDMESNIAMGAALVEQSKAIQVGRLDTDDANYRQACDIVSALRSVEDEIDGLMAPFIDRLFKAHRTATGIRKTYLDPIQAETKRLKIERESYAAEQERQRQEKARKAQEEARRREEARLIEEARLAASQGDSVAAEAILEEALNVEVPTVLLPSATPQVAGTSFRTAWEFEIKDWKLLKPEFIKVDEVAIGKVVRSMHKSAESLVGHPGAIRVWDKKVVVDR